jgi:hypothetical protein
LNLLLRYRATKTEASIGSIGLLIRGARRNSE